MSAQGGVLLGWGYEGHTSDEMLATFSAWNAEYVVDVRLNPVSRKAGFSKKALGVALADAGISYLHVAELGNPQDNRAGFAEPGTPAAREAHGRYRGEVLDTPDARAALARIDELAQEHVVVLLCFEASERCCHRSLVRDAVMSLEAVSSD